jgi:soluble lytic murein transglycosylase-like protein
MPVVGRAHDEEHIKERVGESVKSAVRRRRWVNALVVSVFCSLIAVSTLAHASEESFPEPDPELRSALQQAIASAESFENRYDAEVWLLDMSSRLERYMKEPAERMEFLKLVHAEATLAELEPELVLAVIEVESHFRRFAISPAGALGYMQIMPFWLDELNLSDANLFDPQTNLRFGCTILKHYLKREKGDKTRALARYNGSLGSYRYPKKVYAALDRRWLP